MKRILIPSIVVATILTGVVFGYAMWHAVPLSSQEYFSGGKKYYDQKQFPEATIQFLNAVQKDPTNRDARYYLALIYMSQKHLNEAAEQLSDLLVYHPDDVDAKIRLGNIFLTGGNTDPDLFHKASSLAQGILAKDPANVEALNLSGNAAVGLRDYRSAIELFERVVALDPQNTAAYVSLGSTQALQKNNTEAERAFLKARQVNPRDKQAIISLGNYYRAANAKDKAEALYREALSLYPSDEDIYSQVVSFFYQAGRFEDVIQILRAAQSAAPKDPAPSILLASLYTAKNRPEDTRTLLLDLKKRFPDSPAVAGNLAMNLMQDHPDQAQTEIDGILKADPGNLTGRLLRGQLQFSVGQFDEAQTTLQKYPQDAEGFPQASFLLGKIADMKGHITEAQQHYQRALSANSAYLPARVGLAEVLMSQGKLVDSRFEINRILKVQPDNVPARILEATLNTAEKKYSDAEPELAALVREQPNNPLVHRQMGIYLESRGRTADAEKSFTRALELQPKSQSGLSDLATFYVHTKQADRAIQKINSVPENEKQAYHYEMLGNVYAQTNNLTEAESSYKKALEKDPSGTGSIATLLANLYIRSGHLEEGMKELDIVTAKNPSNADAFTIKGMIREKQEKIEDAKQNYMQALKIKPNSDTAGNNLAFILAEQGQDLVAALGYAQMARRQQPENPDVADTLGWVYYKLGNLLLAREQLQFAVGKDPSRPDFQYHLGLIYKGNKQTEEAKTALAKAANSPIAFKEKSVAQSNLNDLR